MYLSLYCSILIDTINCLTCKLSHMKTTIALSIFVLAFAFTSYSQCSNPYAGEDAAVCGNTCTLNVENATTGYWTAYIGGDELTPAPNYVPSNTNADVTVPVPSFDDYTQIVTFVWTDDSGPCTDTVNVRFSHPPIASVGELDMAEVCSASYVFSADTTGSSWATEMYWTAPDFLCSFDDATLPDASVVIDPSQFGDSAYFSARFVWNMVNYACHRTDTAEIVFYQKPVAFAGEDFAVCGYSAELGAIFSLPESPNYTTDCFWTCVHRPISSSMTDIQSNDVDSTSVEVTHLGIYKFAFRENNSLLPSCNSRDTVQIEFVEIPVVYAGDDQEVCGTCFEMEVISAGFNGYWISASCYDGFLEPDQMYFCCSSYGDHEYIWMEENQSITSTLICSSSDTIVITNYRVPTANIITETNTIVYGLTYENLIAEYPGNGIIGYWVIDNPLAYFVDEFSFETSVTVPDYGSYEIYWHEENGPFSISAECSDESSPITIHFVNPAFSSSDVNDNQEILIFPNPATRVIKIVSEQQPIEIIIYDTNGRIVLNPSNVNENIDISELEAGIYFVKILFDEFTVCRKFVKQ